MIPREDHLNTIKLMSFILMIIMGIAIFNLPYGYYTFLRFATLICSGFIVLNFYTLDQFENPHVWVSITTLVLWNPIFPFYMERSTWVFFNLVATVYFGYIFFKIKT